MKNLYILALALLGILFAGGEIYARCTDEQVNAVAVCEQARKSKPSCRELACHCMRSAEQMLYDTISCLNAPDSEDAIAQDAQEIETSLYELSRMAVRVDAKEKEILARNPSFNTRVIEINFGRDVFDALQTEFDWSQSACIRAASIIARAGLGTINYYRQEISRVTEALRQYETQVLDPELRRLRTSNYGRNCNTEFRVQQTGSRNVLKATDVEACQYIYWYYENGEITSASEIRGMSYCVYGETGQLESFARQCAARLLRR